MGMKGKDLEFDEHVKSVEMTHKPCYNVTSCQVRLSSNEDETDELMDRRGWCQRYW